MKRFDLTKYQDCNNLLQKTPNKKDYDIVIKDDTSFYLNGECIGIYINVDKKLLSYVREAAKETKYVETYRTHLALPTKSSVFGALPRIALRNDFCRFSNQTIKEKQNFNKLFTFQETLCSIYKKHLPELYDYDLKKVQELINNDYRLIDTPYTTANINVNHAIKYHKDTGNFRGNLSNVLILRDGIIGGQLVFPEYGFALAQEDGYLAIFDGQSEIHGVMPIIKTKENPYRASIVYYTLENMKHCYPFKMEVERLQNLASVRANNRASNKDPRTK
jgi:hypothetical protein